ncbi:porin [Massilia sp. G4R7]|uniref:Porin n=1 Tax=Massilia phyllostachyos TaxID=2898585 RepID=A0ABS8QD62_9BURK|nr:porin [Massilia phyllostachyos]MCD2519670.1 porin [Massilia phyllostachyos]
MKMSIVACAVLGASAACASAQNNAPSGDAGAGAAREAGTESTNAARVREAVVQADGAHAAKAPGEAPAIFMLETAQEAEARRAAASKAEVLTVGRQYNIDFSTLNEVGDPFQGGLAGSASGAEDRLRSDDSVSYRGNYKGFTAGSSWGRGDIDGSPSGRAWGMTAGFKLGPFTIRAAHQNRNVAKVTRINQVDITMAAKNSIVAANYDLGWGKAYAAYSANRGWVTSPLFNPDNPYGAAGLRSTPSTDSRDVLAGVAVPVTRATTLLASYIRKNDRDPANRDARQMAVGATYAVSRRLDFYAAYSHIQHTGGLRDIGSRGSGSAVNVGMRRAF